jgi:hypothetical protein
MNARNLFNGVVATTAFDLALWSMAREDAQEQAA